MISGAISLLFMASACHKEDVSNDVNSIPMVTPQLTAFVDTPQEPQSPMTGILEVFPCNAGTSTYFGNYINNKLTVFNGFYPIKEGHTLNGYNRELTLPERTYNMVYWGTPVYEEPTYSAPAIVTPGLSLGTDLSKSYLSLKKNTDDDTYRPVYDLVHAIQETDIAEESLNASLKRVVAGLKVTVTNQDKGTFSDHIASMEVRIHGIAERLNYYTAEAENMDKTVKFPLVRSEDGMQMSNATVMLFPSGPDPEFELRIQLKDGSIHTLSQKLNTRLTANSRLALNLVIGDLLINESTGDFTVEDWNETSETIEFPIVY